MVDTGQEDIGPLKIVVCMKPVPLLSAFRFDPETRRLIREGVPLEVNELDVYALSEAIRLRTLHGGEVIAITMGPPQAHEALATALAMGADRTIHLSDRAFGGADTAATARTLSLVIDDQQRLAQYKPAFGNQIISSILSNTLPAMTTLRPGMLHAAEADLSRVPVIEQLPTLDIAGRIRAQIINHEYRDVGVEELESAQIILGVGMGMGDPEHYTQVDRLAALLNAAIGATRNVTDKGWLPKQSQIGLTGRAVARHLYLALGIRGAAEHIAGIRKADHVVSINKNRRAAIFRHSDVGIIGDVYWSQFPGQGDKIK